MKLIITSALLFLATSPLVQAQHDRNYDKHNEFKAKVINSTPIYKYVAVNQPQTYCEPVVLRKTHRRSHDKNTALIGVILGGVIGHAASDNKHKGLGAILGAEIASSLVHNIGYRHNKHSRDIYVKHQNCVVKHFKGNKIRVLDGYKVTYRSQGRIYRTFRQNKPQKYIRIYY
ncbi:MAG: hypothetical protein ACI936_003828 [Paraglaciecola sp.]|jgi:uncharacterized protein YcfJ